jgi:hypothetical protein
MPHAEHEIKQAHHHESHHAPNNHEHISSHHEHHEHHAINNDVPIFDLKYPDKDSLPPQLPQLPPPEVIPPSADPLLATDHQVIMPHLFRYDSRDEFIKHLEVNTNNENRSPELPIYVSMSSLAAADKIMPNMFVRSMDKKAPGEYQPHQGHLSYGDNSNYNHQLMQQMYLPNKASLPQKEYVPVRHYLPPKQYQPMNPNSYSEPGYDLNLPEYVKLPDQTVIPPASTLQAPVDSLNNEYLPAKELSDVPNDGYHVPPPSDSYLPPSEAFKSPADEYLPPPPQPEELEEFLNLDLKVPSRGPQFPIKEEFKLNSDYLAPVSNKSKYQEPPPRPQNLDLEAPSILNSQGIPPTSFVDKYIPPKTKFDIPKNFKRPGGAIDLLEGSDEDLPEPPAPEEIPDIDEDIDQVEEFQQISELPQTAFLGLAKLKKKPDSGDSKEKEKASNGNSKSKPEKLIREQSGPKLPPIPTLPPQPGKNIIICTSKYDFHNQLLLLLLVTCKCCRKMIF